MTQAQIVVVQTVILFLTVASVLINRWSCRRFDKLARAHRDAFEEMGNSTIEGMRDAARQIMEAKNRLPGDEWKEN